MTANKMINAPTPLTAQCGFSRTGANCRSLRWSNSSQAFTTGTSLTIRLRHLEEFPSDCPYRRLGEHCRGISILLSLKTRLPSFCSGPGTSYGPPAPRTAGAARSDVFP
jgi:hypothetical protein